MRIVKLDDFRSGNFLETATRTIYVRVVGDGPVAIVVHGGPGLDHSYLTPHFQALAARHTLVFYDQPGCGFDTTPLGQVSFSDSISQLSELAEVLSATGELSFIAHSFGSTLLLKFLERHPRTSCQKLLLCSPQALTSARAAESTQRLLARIPAEALDVYTSQTALNTKEGNQKAISAILPYYFMSVRSCDRLEVSFYDPTIETRVNDSLGDFDLASISPIFSHRTLIAYGDGDFEIPAGMHEFFSSGSRMCMIANAGHFPFAENPDGFAKCVAHW